jgi:hypothetical protein
MLAKNIETPQSMKYEEKTRNKETEIKKNGVRGLAQETECLPSKNKALSSNPSSKEKEREERRKIKQGN